ncbi:MAG: hypothetical protein ACE5GH_02360 [Fidelibacterota bacterium]
MRIDGKLGVGILPFLFLIPWVESPGYQGVISGRVVNATYDSSAVPQQEVLLYKYVNGEEVQDFEKHATTDVRGYFAFDGLAAGERVTYAPRTLYGDVEYGGIPVELLLPSPSQKSDIVVFESTTSDSAISTLMHHLIIEPEAKSLLVREVLLFYNSGNRTYVGSKPVASGKNVVLKMEMPPRATELQLGGELMSCCVVVRKNQIFDTMELKPGTRQAVLSYQMPATGKETNLTKSVAYPTKSFDVLLLDSKLSKLEVSEDGEENGLIPVLQAEKPDSFQIRGRNYARYSMAGLAGGSMFRLGILPEDVSYRSLASHGDYRWLAPVALILVMVIGYAIHRRGQRAPGREAAKGDRYAAAGQPGETRKDREERLGNE